MTRIKMLLRLAAATVTAFTLTCALAGAHYIGTLQDSYNVAFTAAQQKCGHQTAGWSCFAWGTFTTAGKAAHGDYTQIRWCEATAAGGRRTYSWSGQSVHITAWTQTGAPTLFIGSGCVL